MYLSQKLLKCTREEQFRISPQNSRNHFRPCDKALSSHVLQEITSNLFKSNTGDSHLSNFLKNQKQYSPSYFHKSQACGNMDARKENKFSENLLSQRLNDMPDIGNLEKKDIQCLLYIIYKLQNLKAAKRSEIMRDLVKQKLIDKEILLYLTILIRHPNTNLQSAEKEVFLGLFLELMISLEFTSSLDFFNSHHIFRKNVHISDRYEKEYLKNIMETVLYLKHDQYLYLLNFVSRLEEIPAQERETYLKSLCNERIITFTRLDGIKRFLKQKAPKSNYEKIYKLLLELEKLMAVGGTLATPTAAVEAENVQIHISKLLQMDKKRIKFALQNLMKAGIPNIVRVKLLKDYLIELLQIDQLTQLQILESLKNSMNLTKAEILFIYEFAVKQKLTKEVEKFREIITKVASTPADTSKLGAIFAVKPTCEIFVDKVKPEQKVIQEIQVKEPPKPEKVLDELIKKDKAEEKTQAQKEEPQKEQKPKKEKKPEKKEELKNTEVDTNKRDLADKENLKPSKQPSRKRGGTRGDTEEVTREASQEVSLIASTEPDSSKAIKTIETPPKQIPIQSPPKQLPTPPPSTNLQRKCTAKEVLLPLDATCAAINACKSTCNVICDKTPSFVAYNEPKIHSRNEEPRRVKRNNCFYLCSCGKVYHHCQAHSANEDSYRQKLCTLKRFCY